MQNLYKNRIEIVYKQIHTKILSTENAPRPAAPPFSRQGRSVCFSVYGFFIDFACSQFRAIFHRILRLRNGSCFVCVKWHRMRLYEKCAKSQRHIWTGCTSYHAEFWAASIRKRFRNEFGMTFFFKKFFQLYIIFCNFKPINICV